MVEGGEPALDPAPPAQSPVRGFGGADGLVEEVPTGSLLPAWRRDDDLGSAGAVHHGPRPRRRWDR